MSNITDSIIAFEQGELEPNEVYGLFQLLIDSGLAWELQGFYGRTAAELIRSGRCHPAFGSFHEEADAQYARDEQEAADAYYLD